MEGGSRRSVTCAYEWLNGDRGRDHGGLAIGQCIVRCIVHGRFRLIRTFFHFLSPHPVRTRAHRHFGRLSSSFSTHSLHIPSRIDVGELLGAVVWPRGWKTAADRGMQALARDITSA